MVSESSIVSVIIVNYCRRDFLKSCLQSVVLQTYQPLEIIVVDNASEDDSVTMVKSDFPVVALIENSENRYFAGAHNQGIRFSKGEWILCLNNDVVLEDNLLRLLLEKKDFDPRVGILGGKTLRMDKKTIDTAGLFLDRSRKPLDRGYAEKDSGQYEHEAYVFGIGGPAVLFRRKMLEDISMDGEYFDEDFKVFYEDLDLCWRAHRFGWKAYYVPKAIAYHKRGATTQKGTAAPRLFKKFSLPLLSHELQAHLVKNRYATVIKNDTALQLLANSLFILSYDIRLWAYLVFFAPKTIGIFFRYRSIFKKSFQKRIGIRKRLRQRGVTHDLP